MENFKLILADRAYFEQIQPFRQEFLDINDSIDGTGSLSRMETEEWFGQIESLKNKNTCPNNWVVSSQYLFIRESDNRIVGMLQIRHYFNDFLRDFGGHIGYCIRPSERRRGYGKLMLKMALPYCKELGIERVLITCEESNIGSRNIILANNGRFDKKVYFEPADIYLERYFIEI